MITDRRGFTLLEVVISMMILAFLSLFTVQSIQQALKTKTKVQHEIDKNATLRDALKIMERDINLAFNYRDPAIQLYNMAQKERQKKGSTPPKEDPPKPGDPPKPPPQPLNPELFKPKEDKIVTQFIGEPESLDFTSLSNVRLTSGSPISSQAEIGYKLKSCRRRSTQEQSSKCLWRRVSNYIHEKDITKNGEETVLLENVTDFSLRYLGPGKEEEWVDTWITTERGDDKTKGVFPYAVEITIGIKDSSPGAKDKNLKMTMVAAIRNPNNPKKEENKDGQQNPDQPGNPPPGNPSPGNPPPGGGG